MSRLTCLHTLALTEYGQLAPTGSVKQAWLPTSSDRPPCRVLLQPVTAVLEHLAPSVRFLLLHAYTSMQVVEELRSNLPPWVRLLHEPRSDSWVRAASF